MAAPHPEWAEDDFTRLSCDLLDVFTGALRAAGRNLTTDRLALGVETLKNLDASLVGGLTYGPNKHWGISLNRTSRYFKECKCWKNIGPWEPLYL
jgi:hypothetical protein